MLAVTVSDSFTGKIFVCKKPFCSSFPARNSLGRMQGWAKHNWLQGQPAAGPS